MLILNVVAFLTRLVVGSILILAGMLKLQGDSQTFLKNVLAYDLVTPHIAKLITSCLPWLEFICGLFLTIGFFLPITILISFGLLLIFTIAIASAVVRENPVNCGCFGRMQRNNRVRWQLAYRNLALMGLIMLILKFENRWLVLDVLLPHSWLSHFYSEKLLGNGLFLVWLTTLLVIVSLHLHTRHHTHSHKTHNVA
jgi:uncharacterized membrane protein YphA (DoxX/SURF4 family)